MSHPQQYIVEQDPKRQEPVATRYLIGNPSYRERLLGHLGVPPELCWIMLDLRLEKIVPSLSGDIDVLAGPLSCAGPARTPERGSIMWPPPLGYLVGIEVKRAYRDEYGNLQATKRGPGQARKTLKQLRRDLGLGLDRVALLDVIAHHPATGTGSAPWVAAGATASDSLAKMENLFRERLSENGAPIADLRPVGQFVLSIGSVSGGDETIRGSVEFELRRPARANPSRTDRSPEFEEGLRRILEAGPAPSTLPIILTDCRFCNAIHLADGPHSETRTRHAVGSARASDSAQPK